jgi:hypothetical protein
MLPVVAKGETNREEQMGMTNTHFFYRSFIAVKI